MTKPNHRVKQFHIEQKMAVNNTNISKGWYVTKAQISYGQTTEIGKFAGGTLYGYLTPEFASKYLQNSLNKGFAKTEYGSNGIKFLDGKLLELKTDSGIRPYTEIVYKNESGDYLAVFGQEAKHNKIKKLVNSLKSIICSEVFSSEEAYKENMLSMELVGNDQDHAE